ncbi:unnamed protein product, partial [Phaeothamnion confervicola]
MLACCVLAVAALRAASFACRFLRSELPPCTHGSCVVHALPPIPNGKVPSFMGAFCHSAGRRRGRDCILASFLSRAASARFLLISSAPRFALVPHATPLCLLHFS